ncbi:MAG: hypothetical protein LBP58_01365 [Azoarcus sp.]|jgi:hypothetical protein|nr:hypothetical protein [Azoarcus sp.]
MLSHIPASDYGDLRCIVFRQPKRKEYILLPVWGRLMYAYEFENVQKPAILLEAQPNHCQLKWPGRLTLERRNELERLRKDGHVFVADKRDYTVSLTPETIRATQLYRTLLHEVGHYVQYCRFMKTSLPEFAAMSAEERNNYFRNSVQGEEKEKSAHAHADQMREDLLARGVIPFPCM